MRYQRLSTGKNGTKQDIIRQPTAETNGIAASQHLENTARKYVAQTEFSVTLTASAAHRARSKQRR
jgi:hypothetical protein